jgi:CRISPR-associated endoribonuclease Cas6
MRIHLKITRNKEIVPFSYQENLVSALHRWLGKDNEYHNQLSLYSMSWLSYGKQKEGGLDFPKGTSWFISAFDDEMIKTIVRGIYKEPLIGFGMKVSELLVQVTPEFSSQQKFTVASPVLVKDKVEGSKNAKFYFYDEQRANELLTKTLQNKLRKAGLAEEGAQVMFDTHYHAPKVKKATYKGIENKGSVCPVLVQGSSEQIAFAWNVGVGHSTGIGFGALI